MRFMMTRAGTPLLSMQAEMTVVEPYLCGAPSYAPVRSYNFQMAFSVFSLVASSTWPAAYGDCGSMQNTAMRNPVHALGPIPCCPSRLYRDFVQKEN